MLFAKPFKLGVADRVEFSPDGKYLATLSQHINIWDVAAGKRIVKTRPLSHCSRITFSPCSRKLAVTNTSAHSVILDVPKGSILHDLKNSQGAGEDGADPVFSKCGKYLVTGTRNGSLLVREIVSGRLVFEEKFPRELIEAVIPIGNGPEWLIHHQPRVVPGEDRLPASYLTRWKWPFANKSYQIQKLPDDFLADKISPSPDGLLLAIIAWGRSSSFQIVRLSDFKVLHTQTIDLVVAQKPNWSASGEWVGFVQRDHALLISSKDFNNSIKWPIQGLRAVAFSSNNDYVAFGCNDKNSCVKSWKEVFGT